MALGGWEGGELKTWSFRDFGRFRVLGVESSPSGLRVETERHAYRYTRT